MSTKTRKPPLSIAWLRKQLLGVQWRDFLSPPVSNYRSKAGVIFRAEYRPRYLGRGGALLVWSGDTIVAVKFVPFAYPTYAAESVPLTPNVFNWIFSVTDENLSRFGFVIDENAKLEPLKSKRRPTKAPEE